MPWQMWAILTATKDLELRNFPLLLEHHFTFQLDSISLHLKAENRAVGAFDDKLAPAATRTTTR